MDDKIKINSLPAGIDFSGYKSPVKIDYSNEKWITEFIEAQDRYIVNTILDLGIEVDKNELVKALEYDRGQYETGYIDGYKDGYKKAFDEAREILRKTLNETFKDYLKEDTKYEN